MQFITSLFGDQPWLTWAFALAVVIVGIVLVTWLLRMVLNASSNVGRGRNRRLAVVDSLALDPKRQLLIVRRDNVEHLILTNGSHDLVIETGIAIEEAATAQPARRPLPMAAAARRPVPQVKPAAPAAVAVPVAAPQPASGATPETAIEQVRALGQNTDKKQHLSLRHTGLLRPVSDADRPVSPENVVPPVLPAADSAKEDGARRDHPALREIEGTDFVDDDSEANRR